MNEIKKNKREYLKNRRRADRRRSRIKKKKSTRIISEKEKENGTI
jgi:hypothetical protein